MFAQIKSERAVPFPSAVADGTISLFPIHHSQLPAEAPASPPPLASWLRILAVGRDPKRTLLRAAVLAEVCLVVFKWVLLPVRVAGISMAPTYADRSLNFVNRVAYLGHGPRRGDVVGIRLTPPEGGAAP
jgi:hypothetical protein